MLKKLAILVLASGCIITAKADSNTTLASSAATTTNNSVSLGIANAGATENIIGNAAWAGPLAGSSWVSFASTGSTSDPGFYTVPNGTAVTFAQTFALSGTVTSASLYVLADDTTSVFINGTEIAFANLGGSYPTCSSVAIGCLTGTEGIFTTAQIAPYLVDGTNTISFVVYQEAGSSFGLDYSGAIATPEPGSLLMLGSGLFGLAAIGRRKLLS